MLIIEVLHSEMWLILATIFLLYLARKVYAYRRLSHFEGPWGVGFFGFPHSRQIMKTETASWYERVCEKHGVS